MILELRKKDTLFRNNEIHLKASYRFAQTKYVDEINEELHRIINEYQENSNYEVIVEPLEFMPPVYNDENESEEAYIILKEHIGDNAIPIKSEFPPHGRDDFALFQSELASGLFFFLGFANIEKGIRVGMHNPNFDIDENCLEFGVKTMSMFLLELLTKSNSGVNPARRCNRR